MCGICRYVEESFLGRATGLFHDDGTGWFFGKADISTSCCRACALSLSDCVFHSNGSAGHDLCPQSASMDQSARTPGSVRPSRKREFAGRVPRRRTLRHKTLTHEMIQPYASGLVPPCCSRRNRRLFFCSSADGPSSISVTSRPRETFDQCPGMKYRSFRPCPRPL